MIKNSIQNLFAATVLVMGTVIGSKGYELLRPDGYYDYQAGFIFGLLMFGALSLADFAFELCKSTFVLAKGKFKKAD
ncbi:TMhelix containing protein [Vibrio phage 1.135.O._10N.222.54.B6]|nr:TMhelix containing protein [Vibrio phage 1.135.O._10N.222.54.B6]